MNGKASPWTVLKERDYLSALFQEAVRRKLIGENPFAQLRVRKPTQEQIAAAHHILAPQEARTLVAAAREMDAQAGDTGHAKLADVFLFMLKTGFRDDEVRKLEWSDVDFDQALIHVKPKRVVETRTVPIPEHSLAKLKKQIEGRDGSDKVFANLGEARRIWFSIRDSDDLLLIPCSAIDLANKRIVFTKEYQWRPKAS